MLIQINHFIGNLLRVSTEIIKCITTLGLQESQILQNSSEILANFAFLTRILQVCTRIANLLQCRTFLTRF